MKTTTFTDILNMTNEHYIKHPMKAVELRINVIFAKNPHLRNSIIRYIDHPSIRKYSHIPLIISKCM